MFRTQKNSHTNGMGNFFADLKKEYRDNQWLRLVVVTVLVYALMKYALSLFLPFLLGFLLVTWIRPFLARCSGGSKTGRSLLAVLALVGVASVPCILLFALYRAGMNCIGICMDHMGELREQCMNALHTCCGYLQKWSGTDSALIEARILRAAEGIGEQIGDEAIPTALTMSSGVVMKVGRFGVLWAVFFIFSVLLAKDYEEVLSYFRQYPWYHGLVQLYDKTVRMLLSYLKSQLIIMSVVGGICSIVFWLMGYPSPFFWGYLVGFLDMLPFIGAGITLLPLAVLELILGGAGKAAVLVLLYVVCYFVRQFMEPRLIGKRIGIHPLIMLVSVFAGVKLYGLPGILTGPLSYLLIRELAMLPGGKRNCAGKRMPAKKP